MKIRLNDFLRPVFVFLFVCFSMNVGAVEVDKRVPIVDTKPVIHKTTDVPTVKVSKLTPIVATQPVAHKTVMAPAVEVNKIAAVVNGSVVTEGEVRETLNSFMDRIKESSKTAEEFRANIVQTRQDIIDKKINDILIAKDFEKQKGKMPEAYVETEVEEFIKNRFAGKREVFVQYLHGLGKSLRIFKEELKRQLIVDYVSGKRSQEQLRVSPKDVKVYYDKHQEAFRSEEKVSLRQITLEPSPQQAETAKIIDAAVQKKDVKEFIHLAECYNSDAELKKTGGSCGWVARKDLRPEFADTLFKLPRGVFSQPFTLSGYVFFFYVEDRQENSIKPLSEVYADIEKYLQDEQAVDFESKWVKSLREKSFVKYF